MCIAVRVGMLLTKISFVSNIYEFRFYLQILQLNRAYLDSAEDPMQYQIHTFQFSPNISIYSRFLEIHLQKNISYQFT